MSQQDIDLIEVSLKDAKETVGLAEALQRLHKNRDFKKVILEGFFEKEAIRLVHLKGQPEAQTEELQKAIIAQIDAIGSLRGYFGKIFQAGNQASKSINEYEKELEGMLQEDLDNE